MPDIAIRSEQPGDEAAIAILTDRAFKDHPHSAGTEVAIVEALRQAGALRLSLVAMLEGALVGHVAFSPVRLNGKVGDWLGLGPISVSPDWQGQGIGSALMQAGLDQIRAAGATGCILLGDPAFYGRFGFRVTQDVRYGDMLPGYLQYLLFAGDPPMGVVAFDPAFDAV